MTKNILIISHRNPDADAIGSSLALSIILKKLGHNVNVIMPTGFATFLNYLPKINTIFNYDDHKQKVIELFENVEEIYCLDFNSLGQAKDTKEYILKSKAKKIMIDHHKSPENFCDIIISKSEYSATCELLYDFFLDNNWQHLIDKEVAICLYSGIVSDTGSFKYPNVRKETHIITSKLLSYDIPFTDINQYIFGSFTKNKLKYIGYCISEKLEYLYNNSVAVLSINKEEMNRFDYKLGFNEGLVNYGLNVEDVKISILVCENRDNDPDIKISFRSKGNIKVNNFASKYFQGGGHDNAAGGKSTKSLKETLIEIKEKVKEIIPSSLLNE